MKFPLLYKKTKTGAVQQYSVETIEDKIIVIQGQVEGKKQQYLTKCKAKNMGRANETSPEEQAELEAQSKWNKKHDREGYTLDPSGEVVIKLPMKVKDYFGQENNVIFPCAVSPKLDGVNAIYRLGDDESLTLWSRGGLQYPPIPHLENHVRLTMSTFKCRELNGELYIHGQHLQDITGAVKKPKELSKDLIFNIFDIPDNSAQYRDRGLILANANINKSRPVSVVEICVANNHEDLEVYHKHCTNDGYEGIVIRNFDGLYKYNERSSDVFKMKKAKDAEFKVLGYEIDKNKHPVLICAAGDNTFKVKPKGTSEERTLILQHIDEYLGNWYKVQFENWSKDNIPLKPVGIGLRACDAQGEPVE